MPTTCRPRGTNRGSLRAVRGLVDGALGAVRETSCVWTINLFIYCLYATSTGLVALASAAVLANLGPLSFLAVPAGAALGVVAIATGVPAGLCALCVATGGSLGGWGAVLPQQPELGARGHARRHISAPASPRARGAASGD